MPTEPTRRQRMQALPPVPSFGPGQAGFTPPFRGSVAAATPIAAPKAKAKLLSWKDVEEKRRREGREVARGVRRGAIAGRPSSALPLNRQRDDE
eukprot:1432383-Alexandrium_andersonii.AAC.1